MQSHVLPRLRSRLLAVLAVISTALVSVNDRVAASPLPSVDKALMAALKEPATTRALELFGAADRALEAAHRGRQGKSAAGTDLDVTVRARLIDNMRDVIAFEMQNQSLESVRLQVRSLDLVRSLWEAANARQAEKTPELEALVGSVYDRLAATGARDQNAKTIFGLQDGETLLYRIMVLQEGAKLSAFELAGNRGAKRATWRETPMRVRGADLLSKAATLVGAAAAANVPFPAAAYPLLLVIGGAMGEADARAEAAMARRLAVLPDAGIVPVVVEGAGRPAPLLAVPAIEGSAEARAGFAGAGAVLFHRGSGAVVRTFERMSSPRDLDAALAAARELADEILGDIGRAAAPKAAANTEPADADASGGLSALLPVVKPASAATSSVRDLVAVIESTRAVGVEGGKEVKLAPDVPLSLAATLAGTGWAQYAIEGSETGPLVWLRRDQVGAYVPPSRADETETEDPKASARKAPAAQATAPKGAPRTDERSWLGNFFGKPDRAGDGAPRDAMQRDAKPGAPK